MADYRITAAGVQRASDGAIIPENAGNRDYRAYLDWRAAGGIPDPMSEPTLAERKTEALAALAAHRYAVEIGGTAYGGIPVTTDRASQALVAAAYQMARDGYWSGGWKFADGVYRPLSSQQVMELALTVGAHVETSFFHESLIADQIRAATDEAGLEWEW